MVSKLKTAPKPFQMPKWRNLDGRNALQHLGPESGSQQPPLLHIPDDPSVTFRTTMESIRNGHLSLADAVKTEESAMEFLLQGAVLVDDRKLIKNTLKQIAKVNWNLLSPASYRILIDALLPSGRASLAPTANALGAAADLFSAHLRAHPSFHTAPMQSVARHLILAVAASSQPMRAVSLLGRRASIIIRSSMPFLQVPVSGEDVNVFDNSLTNNLRVPRRKERRDQRAIGH